MQLQLLLESKTLLLLQLAACLHLAHVLKSGRIHCYPKNAEDIHLGGAEHLTMYPYKPTARAYFCNKCGTHLLMDDSDPVELKAGLGHDMNVTAVTLRILQGLDLAKVNVNQYNGRDNAPIYVVK